MHIPTGYLVDNHCVFGNPEAGSILSRSYVADFPDMSASDDETFVSLERDMRLMLGCMTPDDRLQLTHYTGNEFAEPLDRFEGETEKSKIEICSKVRGELVSRFRKRMANETLIQSNVRLSISTRMPAFVKDGGRKTRGFKDVFKVLARSFEQRARFFDLLLAGYGGGVTPLDNAGHYEELLRFWSPGQSRVPRFPDLDFLRTIEDLCVFSGLSPRPEPSHGFYMDGFYFGLIVAKTMPRATWAKSMEPFLALTIPNLRVVVNMRPLGIEIALAHEKERWSKLWSNAYPKDGEPDPEAIEGLRLHQEQIGELLSNKKIPFKAQLIVIACDRTPDGLDARMEGIRAALGKTGCEALQPSLATSTVSFYNCATPGFGPWAGYPDYWHKMDDAVNVAHMWPAGSTPRADLDFADWIADGDQNNLIGGRCFHGAGPAHMMAAGSTGYAKSSTLQTIALQTAPQFKFICVIDDGLSWMTTCHKLDPSSRPIAIRSNGGQTFNLLDTGGLPRSHQHLASATALCHLLVGRHSDTDKDKLRAAILAETIQEVYGVAYRRWRNSNPEAHYDLCRRAGALVRFQKDQGLETFLDAFLEAKALSRGNIDLLTEYEGTVDEDIDRHPDTANLVESLSFASWAPAMFPTLSDLQDELHTASLQKGPHQELCAMLASLLRPWLRDGRYGPIVDGASNVDLGSAQITEADPLKVVHFELGELGESEAELRAVAGFLITNHVRNHIQGMSRGIRKQVVVEEMVAFLKVPNAEDIIVSYWQQARKFSCQMVAVFQTYSTLLEASPKVAKAVVSNSSQLLLLGNRNRSDIETLSGYLPRPIPQVIVDQITRFPKPSDMPKNEAYAGFVLVTLDSDKPKYVVGRNVITHEVELITSSSGDVFERKKKDLRNESNATNGNHSNGEHAGSGRLRYQSSKAGESGRRAGSVQ